MTEPILSARAEKLLQQVRNPHRWFRTYGSKPKAMQELVDAGLVTTGTRMPIAVSCYVPVGYRLIYEEKFPK